MSVVSTESGMSAVLDAVRTALGGREGRAWAGSVEDLLFDGETVRREVPVGDNRVVVTTHRVLAFTPESDGENYRRVDLPNVADVRAGHEGETNLLRTALRTFAYGGVLLAVGVAVDFEAIVPTDAFSGTGQAAGQVGVGGLLGVMQRMLGVIAQLDRYARLVGAVLVLFGVFVVAVYYLTRERVLVVAVAGDAEDIHVPAPDADVDGVVTALERALFEGGDAGGGGTDTDAREEGGTAGQTGDAGFKSDDPL